MAAQTLTVKQLTVDNVKRIKAVDITPAGNMVVIGGQNANGKSSVLDSIEMALGGKGSIPDVPVRRGEDSARIVLDLDDIIVKRTFKATGETYLSVEGKDGTRFSSPQAVLDKLNGTLSFDPLAFSRMDPKQQLAKLRELTGLDFTALDNKRQQLYDDRTDINRQLKNSQGALAAVTRHPEAPAEPVSAKELTEELTRRQATNAKNAESRRNVIRESEMLHEAKRIIGVIESEIVELEQKLVGARTRLGGGNDVLAQQQKHYQVAADLVRGLIDADEDEIKKQLAEADGINQKVRDNQNHAALKAKADELAEEANRLTNGIDYIDQQKQEQLAAAKFPVPGLSFDDNGVLFNALPFDQASGAEQLKVCAAIGFAMNPKLRILLIRDGSLLDESSLTMLRDMAAENASQIWLERVGDSAACQIIIEDGMVKEIRKPSKSLAAV